MRMVIASTSSLSHVTSGKSRDTSAAISSQNTMPWRCALDLVTTVRCFAGAAVATSKANRMIRSTPRRVKIAISVATSSGRPRCAAAALAGIFALAVLPHDHPVEVARPDVAQRTI